MTVVTESGLLVWISAADVDNVGPTGALYGRQIIGAGSEQQVFIDSKGRPVGYTFFRYEGRVLVN